MNLSIRDVDEKVVKRFKVQATDKGLKMGDALTMAMQEWIDTNKVKNKVSILDYKPTDWGPGTENASQEIDKTLYGE